jgi:molybdenum cofactor cytidylyltransferase
MADRRVLSSAIVLAAGLSQRMGRFKLTLPWGDRTVISQVVATLEVAGVGDIVVVAGHRGHEVASALQGTRARTAFNPNYANGEMLGSIYVGLRTLLRGLHEWKAAAEHEDKSGETVAGEARPTSTLLCLGDQPQLEAATVRVVLAAGEATGWERIVIPSFRMRAGHPILLPSWVWPEILACNTTLRDVLAAHRRQTHYLPVETSTVLADLDTPQDYAQDAR